jgi:hypothetical protein
MPFASCTSIDEVRVIQSSSRIGLHFPIVVTEFPGTWNFGLVDYRSNHPGIIMTGVCSSVISKYSIERDGHLAIYGSAQFTKEFNDIELIVKITGYSSL